MFVIASYLHIVYHCHMNKDFRQILKNVGLKVTPAREHILRIFSACLCKPINADYLFERFKSQKINRVTIYRTLESLEQKNIIKRVDLRKGSAYYELVQHHHHHIICTNCGRTEGFEVCEIEKISKTVLKKSPLFDKINQHSLELFGLCTLCSRG